MAAALDLRRPLPAGLPDFHPQFAAHRRVRVPPNIVARLRNGRVVAPYAATIAEDDTLLFDLSPYYGVRRPTQHPIFLRWRLPRVNSVVGSVGVLDAGVTTTTTSSPTSSRGWSCCAVPARIRTPTWSIASPGSQRDMLDHLGLTADRCIGSDKYPHLHADELVVPSLPDANLKTPPWIVAWLHARFLPATLAAPYRRLYVGRGDKKHTRRVENEADLLAALEPLGFEAIDPAAMSPGEQVRAFAEAECIVGPHGAGLTNLAFAPAGAAVVELFAHDYVNECFWALATAVGRLRYRYLVGDGSASGVGSGRNRGVASDIRVDPRQVRRLLEDLL